MALIGLHPVHRRLAELQITAGRRGGWHMLDSHQQMELQHCLQVNTKLVVRMDELKQLAFQAHLVGDHAWEQDICQQIDELEEAML